LLPGYCWWLYWAFPGEKPVFDFFNYLPVERIRGFSVVADYLHFKGLELRGVQQVITGRIPISPRAMVRESRREGSC